MKQSIKLKLTITIIMFSFSTMAFQCGKPKSDCEEVVCTQELKAFNIITVDAQKNAIIPDAVIITNMATGIPITTFTQNTSNSYVVFNDGNLNLVASRKEALSIKVDAVLNNIVKASTTLQFTKDCCHVVKISGADSLIIN